MASSSGSGGFLMVMGVTFVAFSSGFGVCLFNLDSVDACVNLANTWVGSFKGMGDHIIAWGKAVVGSVFSHKA